MRWYVDVSLLGAEESPTGQGVTVTVEAESWQRALMAARALRGERTPISGFSIEVRDGATRATDPIARMTYVVRNAPVDAELSTFGGLPGDSSADVTAPRKTMSQLSRMVLSPPMASPSTTLVDAQPPPADLQLDASSTGNIARINAAAPSDNFPDPTEPSAKALMLGPDDTGEQRPDVVVLFRREQEPSPAAPLHYREYVFAVAPGTSEANAELVLRDELARIQDELATVSRGKMVNLAVFDETFAGPPRVLPLVTLAWKDWRGDPLVDFPRRRGTAAPPQAMSFPPPAPPRSAPSMPPAAPSAPSVPHAAPSVPQAAPSAPSVSAARSVPPPPPAPSAPRSGPAIPTAAGSSPALPGMLRSAPTLLQHGKSAPLPPAAPPSAPSIPEAAPSAPAFPQAAASAPKLPEAAPSKPLVPAAAPSAPAAQSAPEIAVAPPMRPPTESDPALPPPAPLPTLIVDASPVESEPVTQSLPDTADVAVTSVRGPMSSSFPPLGDLPQASPATVNREDTIPPDTMQMPPLDALPAAPLAGASTASPAKAPEPLPPMRRQLSSVLPALFEAMHDLAFLRDAVEGAEFCLNLALEQIPASAGIVHLYDMERRVFEAVAVKGERALPRLHDLTPDGDPRFAAAMRATVPPPPLGRSSNPPPPKPSVPVNDGDSVLVPIAKDRRYLGAFELLGPTDGAPLGADEEQALKYIADQYAEFFGSRGYKFGRNSVPRMRR